MFIIQKEYPNKFYAYLHNVLKFGWFISLGMFLGYWRIAVVTEVDLFPILPFYLIPCLIFCILEIIDTVIVIAKGKETKV